MNTSLSYHASLADLEELLVRGSEHPAAAHVTRCASCAAQLEQVRELLGVLTASESARPEEQLARVEQRIAQSVQEGVHVRSPGGPAVARTRAHCRR